MGLEAIKKTINLEWTNQIQRTEYSVLNHWELIKKVTGIDTSIVENREEAQKAFAKAWDISFNWNILVHRNYLENRGRVTNMGHAVYQESSAGQTDFNQEVSNPYTDLDDIYALDFFEEFGEYTKEQIISDANKKYQDSCTKFPDAVNMTGTYISLYSGLIEVFGWDNLLMAMGYDSEAFSKVIERYYHWIKQFFDAIAQSDIPYFMCHDDIAWTSGLLSSREWYQKNIFPYYEKLWQPLKEANKKIFFTSDGTYTEILDDIAALKPDVIVMEPTTDMEYFAKKYGNEIGFVGNADVRVLMYGTKDDIYKEVKRCMDLGKEYVGHIMAVGNHIPPNTPVDNCLYYNDYFESMRNR